MKLFKRSTTGLFASQSLLGHLLRGAFAFGLLGWAMAHQSNVAPSLAAAALALIAMRGCPMCWAVGLIETVMQKTKPGTPPP